MRRLFWLAMGVTIGALVVRRLSRAAERLTPRGIAGSLVEGLRDLADAIGEFGADVRAAASTREDELRSGTGLDAPLPERGADPRSGPTDPDPDPGRHAATALER